MKFDFNMFVFVDMHDWIKILATHIQELETSANHVHGLEPKPTYQNLALQQSLALLQQFTQRHKNIETIEAACEQLSKFKITTISDLIEGDKIISSDLIDFEKSDQLSDGLILVCRIQEASSSTCYLKDCTGRLPFVFTTCLHPSFCNQPLLLLKWRFVNKPRDQPSVETYQLPNEEMQYIEIDEALSPQQQIQDQSQESQEKNSNIKNISDFLKSYRDRKYHDITGLVIAKSPLHHKPETPPFFFVQLKCMESEDSVDILIQGGEFVSWHSCSNMYEQLKLSIMKRTILNRGKIDERKVTEDNAT